MVTSVRQRRARGPVIPPVPLIAEQYGPARLVVLHLAPGAIFTLAVLLAASFLNRWGVDPSFVLFGAIGVVLAPLELGYLALYARRTTGSWSPLRAVEFRNLVPGRRLAPMATALAAWFFIWLAVSIAVVDMWLATNVFSWMPKSLLIFSGVDRDTSVSAPAGALIALLVIALVFNGVVGPITEELYFRGHLLPRLERYGRWAPVINTVLFAIYHFFSPWRYPAIIVGFLPITWMVWRKRSIFISIATHMTINTITVLLLIAAFAAGRWGPFDCA